MASRVTDCWLAGKGTLGHFACPAQYNWTPIVVPPPSGPPMETVLLLLLLACRYFLGGCPEDEDKDSSCKMLPLHVMEEDDLLGNWSLNAYVRETWTQRVCVAQSSSCKGEDGGGVGRLITCSRDERNPFSRGWDGGLLGNYNILLLIMRGDFR